MSKIYNWINCENELPAFRKCVLCSFEVEGSNVYAVLERIKSPFDEKDWRWFLPFHTEGHIISMLPEQIDNWTYLPEIKKD